MVMACMFWLMLRGWFFIVCNASCKIVDILLSASYRECKGHM